VLALCDIDQAATEPPPSADSERMERREVDEIIPVAPEPVSAEVAAGTVEAVRRGKATEPEAIGEESVAGPAHFMRSGNSFLGDYISYNDKLGPDPRTVSITVVADHLCRIIEVEGPMIAKRAYDIYLRGCGIRRLGARTAVPRSAPKTRVIDPLQHKQPRVKLVRVRSTMHVWFDFALAELIALAPNVGFKLGSIHRHLPFSRCGTTPRPAAQ